MLLAARRHNNATAHDDTSSLQQPTAATTNRSQLLALLCAQLCLQVSVRVMEIDQFMNSKRLFKILRYKPPHEQPPMPVMVHINYHPGEGRDICSAAAAAVAW